MVALKTTVSVEASPRTVLSLTVRLVMVALPELVEPERIRLLA
jgi:hypothetical protein